LTTGNTGDTGDTGNQEQFPLLSEERVRVRGDVELLPGMARKVKGRLDPSRDSLAEHAKGAEKGKGRRHKAQRHRGKGQSPSVPL